MALHLHVRLFHISLFITWTMASSVLFIRKNDRHQRIRVQDIMYISAAGSYLIIKTATEELSLAQNLSQFVRKNPIASLIRVHRSYIVNIDCVDSFDHDFVYIGEQKIPLGDSYREKFMNGVNCA